MTVAVTCGDPSGIGPEVVQKAWISLKNSPSNRLNNTINGEAGGISKDIDWKGHFEKVTNFVMEG